MRAMVPTAMRPRGGPSALPSWVSEAVAGRWGVVPVAAALSTLDPKLDDTINPDYPASPEWYGTTGFTSIVVAWCGACFDTEDDVLWLPLSGGHADYAGNEPYKLVLNQEVPEWFMVRPPSGAVGNILTTDDDQEASGVYSDGQPRAIHSYNKPVYVPGVGPFISAQGGTSWSAQAGTKSPIKVNPTTGLGTLMAACPAVLASSLNCSAFDATRGTQGSIWARGAGFSKMHRYDVAADTWDHDIGTSTNSNGYASMVHLPDDDCLLVSDSDGLRVFDCAAETTHTPTVTGTSPVTWSACQLVSAQDGTVYTWNNASSTTEITRLVPGADPRTGWTLDTLPVDGGNAVTPTAKASNGTYGRFWYSPNLGCFFVFNSISGSIYFFKP